jgi:hypothetical protein
VKRRIRRESYALPPPALQSRRVIDGGQNPAVSRGNRLRLAL